MALEWPNMVVSVGKTTGANPLVQTMKSRGGQLSRTAAGDYNLTLDEACPAGEGFVMCTAYNGVETTFRVTDTSDTVKRIETFQAGVAADQAFAWVAWRGPAGSI